jgi:hypothetical protein
MIFQNKLASIPPLLLAAVLLFTSEISAPLQAQDLARPDAFFEKNFSESILSEAQRPSETAAEDAKIDADQANPQVIDIIDPENSAAPAHGESPDPAPTTDTSSKPEEVAVKDTPDNQLLEVSHVSFVVASEPKSHLHEQVATYSQTLDYYNLKPAALHMIGRLELGLDFPGVWTRLMARGVAVETDYSVIETLGISKSPTWILHTGEGDIILEGEAGLENYLTADGKFRKTLLQNKNSLKGRKR